LEASTSIPDLATKAAVLCTRIVKNHPLLDGNKRVGFAFRADECATSDLGAWDSVEDIRTTTPEHRNPSGGTIVAKAPRPSAGRQGTRMTRSEPVSARTSKARVQSVPLLQVARRLPSKYAQK
jgi:hypothetical protein